MTLTLGLDLGPNSIGWALTNEDDQKIVDLGVRIFPEGVDNFDSSKEASRNEARRIARGMRRQTRRRALRKQNLRQILIQLNLFPKDVLEQTALYQQDPYALRSKALDEPLTAHEFGRVLLHLNQRRGFLSNRKKERVDKETQGILAQMDELAEEINQIDEQHCKTLGKLLSDKLNKLDEPNGIGHKNRQENDHVRGRHTKRAMLIEEFHAIWQKQATYYPDLLTEILLYGSQGKDKHIYPAKPIPKPKGQTLLQAFGLHGLIFFHRKVYWPASMIGRCELEPKEQRCPKSDRRAERFRVLQEINNLKYIDPDTHQEERLMPEQRQLLLDKMVNKKEMDFKTIKKALGFTEDVKFNLERGERSKLKCFPIDHMLAHKDCFTKSWAKLPEDDKNEIIAQLVKPDRDDQSDEELSDLLIKKNSLTNEQADKILSLNIPAGYINLSLKAINKLMPFLEQGFILMGNDDTDSAMHAAGYLRRDQLQRRLFDKLPDPARTKQSPIGDLPNPVVKRTLTELRKLVNAIIREYGKPENVHIEMAREIKQGSKKRSEYTKNMRDREKLRDAAAKEIRNNNIHVTREAINRYLLWEQQNRYCLYSGKSISFTQLFGGEIDVDHILPYSRTLDDSQMNKVVCFRAANADKGNQTPYEWLFAKDPARYEAICQRALSLVKNHQQMPYGKFKRFTQKELDLDNFIARQLVDTAYIAKVTGEYMRCLFSLEEQHHVLGLKGQLTAELRRQWGLNQILNEQGLDLKTRDDHRHHAVDALVIAMTNRSRLQKLSNIRRRGGVENTGEALEYPWENFRDEAESKINKINVSHRVQRKVAGKLHEETLYGQAKDDQGQIMQNTFVVRKPVDALSLNEIPKIRDPKIREIIINRLKEHSIEFGRGEKTTPDKLKQALANLKMPSGVPIKKVRILKNEKTILPIREAKAANANDPTQVAYIKPGSTHHLSLFEWIDEKGKTKRDAVFTTMLQATNRVKEAKRIEKETGQKTQSEFLITRKHPDRPDAKFLFSLSKGEMVLANWKDEKKYLVFKTAPSTSKQMLFIDHTDARKNLDIKKFSFMPLTLSARKVTVDLLGRIRWAND